MWETRTEYAERAPTKTEIDTALDRAYISALKYSPNPYAEVLVVLYEDHLASIMAENDIASSEKTVLTGKQSL